MVLCDRQVVVRLGEYDREPSKSVFPSHLKGVMCRHKNRTRVLEQGENRETPEEDEPRAELEPIAVKQKFGQVQLVRFILHSGFS